MAEFKLVIGDKKTGKSVQMDVKDAAAKFFLGKKIGDKFKGESIDLTGYEFEIRGGSDKAGFPMRWDVEGFGRKKIYLVSGVGIKKKVVFTKKGDRKIRRKRHGVKQRKTICGNIITENTSQINLVILKNGAKSIFPEGEQKKEGKEVPAAKK